MLGELAEAEALLEQRPGAAPSSGRAGARPPAEIGGAREAVHDGDRRSELVRGDRDELILELVDATKLLEGALKLLVLLGLRDEDAGDEADRREEVQVELVQLGLGAFAEQIAEGAPFDEQRDRDAPVLGRGAPQDEGFVEQADRRPAGRGGPG